MKRLHLLKPNYVTGFLGGAGSKYHCLEIEHGLGYDALKEDVENGARQFADCLKNADRKMSRVVVVKGTKQEEVLMAVNYLAAIANSRETEENGFTSYDPVDCDEYDFWEDEWEDEEDCEWNEVPWRVPVVTIAEIAAHDEDNIIFQGPSNMMFSGIRNVSNKRPYWKDCRNEMMCILIHQKPGFGFFNFEGLTEKLSLFAENRHLFIAYVKPWETECLNDEEVYDMEGLFSYVLENTADMVLISEKEENLKKYRRLQFDNWLEKLSITLESNVPKNEIIDKILKMYNENKSDMMQRILLYVQKESRKPQGEPLGKDDFAVLNKYLSISASQEKKSSERLEKELVGMENVKRQVKSIVSVMKYCKMRQKMGLGESGFHNVHLLIGAPGTAKTTVAKMMGNMMREEGILPGNRFTCVNGAELKGMYVGHSAPKTKQLFEENDIILIDEAYSLVDNGAGSDSYSREAMAQMLIEIEQHGTDKLIMFAGYGGKELNEKDNMMKQFLDANPGLKSRINSTIFFDSYTPEEMKEIVHTQAKVQNLKIDKKADEYILKFFAKRYKDPNFGNGREARSLLENAMVFAAERVMALPESRHTKRAMSLLTEEDIKNAIDRMQENNAMQQGRSGRYGFVTGKA